MGEVRRLGVIADRLETIGYSITYAYEDLLFIEHIPFLLRFDPDDADRLCFYAHNDLDAEEKTGIFTKVSEVLRDASFDVVDKGAFDCRQSQGGSEEIDVTFYDSN